MPAPLIPESGGDMRSAVMLAPATSLNVAQECAGKKAFALWLICNCLHRDNPAEIQTNLNLAVLAGINHKAFSG